jgi:hypothetical protein
VLWPLFFMHECMLSIVSDRPRIAELCSITKISDTARAMEDNIFTDRNGSEDRCCFTIVNEDFPTNNLDAVNSYVRCFRRREVGAEMDAMLWHLSQTRMVPRNSFIALVYQNNEVRVWFINL